MSGEINNNKIQIKVEKIVHGGHALAYPLSENLENKKPIFIRYGLPGEEGIAEITSDTSKITRADLIEITKPRINQSAKIIEIKSANPEDKSLQIIRLGLNAHLEIKSQLVEGKYELFINSFAILQKPSIVFILSGQKYMSIFLLGFAILVNNLYPSPHISLSNFIIRTICLYVPVLTN